jgi:sulfur carrier protein
MNIRVNNHLTEIPDEKNVWWLTEHLEISNRSGIAIAVNKKVIPKSQWTNFMLQESDSVLIIEAAQGG